MDTKEIGYTVSSVVSTKEKYCLLTIGSIIRFNGKKCIVTHTFDSARMYYKPFNSKFSFDTTKSFHGFLKDIDTGNEFRANWYNITKEDILYYENFGL